MAPFTPGVPPGGEASLGHRRATEQSRKGVRCGISRAVGVCIEKARGFDQIFHLSAPDGKLHICIDSAARLRLLPVCSTPRAMELLEEGDNATNKMDTVHRGQHVA